MTTILLGIIATLVAAWLLHGNQQPNSEPVSDTWDDEHMGI